MNMGNLKSFNVIFNGLIVLWFLLYKSLTCLVRVVPRLRLLQKVLFPWFLCQSVIWMCKGYWLLCVKFVSRYCTNNVYQLEQFPGGIFRAIYVFWLLSFLFISPDLLQLSIRWLAKNSSTKLNRYGEWITSLFLILVEMLWVSLHLFWLWACSISPLLYWDVFLVSLGSRPFIVKGP